MTSACLVVLSFAVVAAASEWGNPIFLVDRGHVDALCSDRTSAAYYFRKGAPSGDENRRRRDVLIYLQGGFWCWDEASCALRWGYWDDPAAQRQWHGKHLMSSKTLDNVTMNGNTPGGILNTTARAAANAFAGFDVYYVPYCSSDAWLGATRGEAAGAFVFRGRDILTAVVRETVKQSGAGAPLGAVLLTGTSAGGLGTIHSVDFLRDELLPPSAATRVVGIADGGWFMDVEPAAPCAQQSEDMWDCVEEGKRSSSRVAIPLRAQFQAGYAYWNLSTTTTVGRADAVPPPTSCVTSPWECLFPALALPTIRTPLIALQSLTDSWQLQWNGGLLQPSAIATTLRRNAVQQMEDVARAHASSKAAFASLCWVHGQLTSSSFFDVDVGGVNPHDLAKTLVLGGGTGSTGWSKNESAIEHSAACEGAWNCSRGCPADSG